MRGSLPSQKIRENFEKRLGADSSFCLLMAYAGKVFFGLRNHKGKMVLLLFFVFFGILKIRENKTAQQKAHKKLIERMVLKC